MTEATGVVQENIEELLRENAELRDEISWRKEETKRLRRSIGSGRVYYKLKESLRCAEESGVALRERVENLEAEMDLLRNAPLLDTASLNGLIRRLVEAGDAMRHSAGPECPCRTCEDWREAKEGLTVGSDHAAGKFEDIGWLKVTEEVKVLKVSEA